MTLPKKQRRAAHFLLIPELLYSPPNDAIIRAYINNKYQVDVYAPGLSRKSTHYGDSVKTHNISYSWRWIFKNVFRLRWLKYDCYSGTSEDPLAIVGIFSFLYSKKSFALVDEIKSGSYRGDRSKRWKDLCISGIKNADFQIVNDWHRIRLLQEYVNKRIDRIIVYPGCFLRPPDKNREKRSLIRKEWGLPESSFIIGSSGGFNMTAGADWLVRSIKDIPDMYAVIQPLGINELTLFLLENLVCSERIFLEKRRLDWQEAWESAQGLDVGVCIYTNPAPQFQQMGISSNRLCMFIAMGVPVIVSKQQSFNFVNEFDCGVMVSDYDEFKSGIEMIRTRGDEMKKNCKICHEEYIQTSKMFATLNDSIHSLL